MFIVSIFYDYYDTIKIYGIDKTVAYGRRPETIVLPYISYRDYKNLGTPRLNSETVWSNKPKTIIRPHVIGFCGHLYPVVEIQTEAKDGTKTSQFCYDPKTLRRRISAIKNPVRSGYWLDFDFTSNADTQSFFNPDTWSHLLSQFRKSNTPIFMFTRRDHQHILHINCKLGSMQFAKVKPPTVAFQEIYQYLSGVLGVGERPVVKLSDKAKAAKAGHDGKYSFRRPPKKKRKK